MNYNHLVSEIFRYFPNYYQRHYKEFLASGSFWSRMNIAEGLSHEVNEHFVDAQKPGYTATVNARHVQLPPSKSGRAIELLTDYVLANDHVKGLSLKREASGDAQTNEEFPPLGEGAQGYLERCFIGVPINPAERRRVKKCEICESNFIDRSQRKNAKVCGDTCRSRKEALRKRAEYNAKVHHLESETRLKRYRQRQEYENPFYSPYELNEISTRSERVYEDNKIDLFAYKQDEDFDAVRLNGKRKPMYVGRDEFSEKPFNYRPKERMKTKSSVQWGEVTVRKIADIGMEQLEKEKFVEADENRRKHWNIKG
ncbi:hypothetical protein LCL96_12485 [Rossellomorea aquimaris]|uniref:hypothetical protein n=1 Tax=Rossellomorea aquimaris TaxID=189382 RepID=UPI001CD30802|nr:hypothetical protein [Rossellomorea aquimaris]MCA1059765.1 hypothetical protein [Rossellomorea aquimaris]